MTTDTRVATGLGYRLALTDPSSMMLSSWRVELEELERIVGRRYPRTTLPGDRGTLNQQSHREYDGFILVPPYRNHYGAWFKRIFEGCRRVLQPMGYDVEQYFGGWKDDRIILRPEVCLQVSNDVLLVKHQLGYKYLKTPTRTALRRMRKAHEAPLEPGLALLGITKLIQQRQLTAAMGVECPGVRYAPRASGKFNDVPRWEVRPATDKVRGFIGGDWNWDLRSRHLQGAASGVYIPRTQWYR